MRLRGSLFWGLVLIALAALLFLRQLGLLAGDIFGYFIPLVVVLFGAWLLIGALTRRGAAVEGQTVSIPLENARSARIKLDHGAGRLNVSGGAATSEALNGTFGGEVEYKSRLEGDRLEVKVHNSPHLFWAWYPGQSLDWDIRLNNDVPLSLKIDSGASSSTLDLSALKVVELDVDSGASSTEVTLPANAGNTRVDIDTGASSLSVRVPTGVAARIRIKSGVAAVNVDTSRFPRLESGLYQSADYASATNRADVTVNAGVGSIEVK
jgi:hypothetical protein